MLSIVLHDAHKPDARFDVRIVVCIDNAVEFFRIYSRQIIKYAPRYSIVISEQNRSRRSYGGDFFSTITESNAS